LSFETGTGQSPAARVTRMMLVKPMVGRVILKAVYLRYTPFRPRGDIGSSSKKISRQKPIIIHFVGRTLIFPPRRRYLWSLCVWSWLN
jgi:hypothetical protein